MNSVNIIGRIAHDLQVKETTTGKTLLNFSVAYNQTRLGQKHVSYFPVVAWEKNANTIAHYFKKGDRIGIVGRLIQDRYNDINGKQQSKINIVLDRFGFIDKKNVSPKPAEEEGDQYPEHKLVPKEEKDWDFSDFQDVPYGNPNDASNG